ncbi:MAG: hypothetical protein WC655_10190 [Candidatus Hydrogenedentales bacterium]
MKKGTFQHPKNRDLARRLGMPTYASAGLLEALWHFTYNYAKPGNVGRVSNLAIAEGIDYEGDPNAMVEALVGSGWLDESEKHRLIVHGWSEHAEDSVHRSLARAGLYFADGALPSFTRLSNQQKLEAKVAYEANSRHENDPGTLLGAQECTQDVPGTNNSYLGAPTLVPKGALPLPIPLPIPVPVPVPSPIPVPPPAPAPDPAVPVAENLVSAIGSGGSGNRKKNPAPASPTRDITPEEHKEKGDRLQAYLMNAAASMEGTVPPTEGDAAVAATCDEGNLGTQALVQSMTLRILKATSEPKWKAWWYDLAGTLYQTQDGWAFLEDRIHYVEMCADSHQRQMKSLGPLAAPGAFLVKQVTAWCRDHDVKWPAFPEGQN